jgi:hypothetical protein
MMGLYAATKTLSSCNKMKYVLVEAAMQEESESKAKRCFFFLNTSRYFATGTVPVVETVVYRIIDYW